MCLLDGQLKDPSETLDYLVEGKSFDGSATGQRFQQVSAMSGRTSIKPFGLDIIDFTKLAIADGLAVATDEE